MNVFVLYHDDAYYDMGSIEIRDIYANMEDAERALVTRTPSGRRSKAYGAHDEDCCSVVEWEVLEASRLDVQDDPPPPSPNDRVVPESFIEAMAVHAAAPNPFSSIRTTPPHET